MEWQGEFEVSLSCPGFAKCERYYCSLRRPHVIKRQVKATMKVQRRACLCKMCSGLLNLYTTNSKLSFLFYFEQRYVLHTPQIIRLSTSFGIEHFWPTPKYIIFKFLYIIRPYLESNMYRKKMNSKFLWNMRTVMITSASIAIYVPTCKLHDGMFKMSLISFGKPLIPRVLISSYQVRWCTYTAENIDCSFLQSFFALANDTTILVTASEVRRQREKPVFLLVRFDVS